MDRYLITHSLLSSWLYTMKSSPHEDISTETDRMNEFMLTLRREKTPTTEAMQNGINFENLVTSIVNGDGDKTHNWYDAASNIANIIRGGMLQYRAYKEIQVDDLTLLLYGRLDALKAGIIYDIKFSKHYDRGRYIASTQHPAYFTIVPDAYRFEYLISNGSEVWTECYDRYEIQDIIPVISYFIDWLKMMNLIDLYKEKWGTK